MEAAADVSFSAKAYKNIIVCVGVLSVFQLFYCHLPCKTWTSVRKCFVLCQSCGTVVLLVSLLIARFLEICKASFVLYGKEGNLSQRRTRKAFE